MQVARVRPVLAAIIAAVALGSLSVGAQPASALCIPDKGGVDDISGQKDLAQYCSDGTMACVADLTWTWDDTAWPGANTGDACALYDTDDDGNANYALCVSVTGDPAGQSSGSPTFYDCDDSKMLNCGNPMAHATV